MQLCYVDPQQKLFYIANVESFAKRLTTDFELAEACYIVLAQNIAQIKNMAQNPKLEFVVDTHTQNNIDAMHFSLNWFEKFLKEHDKWDQGLQKIKKALKDI